MALIFLFYGVFYRCMRHSFLLILFVFIFTGHAVAQDFLDLAQVGYRYALETKAPEGSDEGVSVSGLRVNLLLPLKLSEKTYLLPGFRYWQYNLNPGDNLQYYFAQIGFQTQLSDKVSWQFLPLLRTGIYDGSSARDGFQIGLLTLVNTVVKDNLTLGYGIYTNSELFGPLLTPVLGIDWQINDRWRLYGNFPMYNTLSYSISEKMNTGVNYVGLVTTFKGDNTYTERQSVDVSWFFDYYLTPQIVAQFQVGYPIGRSFEEFNEKDKVDFSFSLFRFGDDREALNTFDKASMIVTFNLLFRIKK